MFKTEITQIIQIVKIFSHFFIKKLFNLKLSKLFIFFLSITFLSCATYTANSNELMPNLIKCEVSRSVSKKMDYEFIKSSSNKFTKKLDLLGQNKNNYNLFISNGTKPSAGYKLNFDKAIKKNNKINIYFTEIEPPKLSANAAVLTYPYCLLDIKNEKKFRIFINNKKKKKSFFKLSIF